MATIGGAILTACMAAPPGAGPDGPGLPPLTPPGDQGAATPGSPATGPGCTPTGDGVPDGATSTRTVDVDGDGRPDQLWMASPARGPRAVGITTASGATTAHTVSLTGPTALRAMAVDADRSGPTEILVSDGRAVALFVFADCAVAPVRGSDGAPYLLDLGFREQATGVGCVDADGDGMRELVSLARTTAGPEVVGWSRTTIRLDGRTASAGSTMSGTYREPQDHQEIVDLSTVTCGAHRIEDALAEPLPGDTTPGAVATG